jgi:hypothetical protein
MLLCHESRLVDGLRFFYLGLSFVMVSKISSLLMKMTSFLACFNYKNKF